MVFCCAPLWCALHAMYAFDVECLLGQAGVSGLFPYSNVVMT